MLHRLSTVDHLQTKQHRASFGRSVAVNINNAVNTCNAISNPVGLVLVCLEFLFHETPDVMRFVPVALAADVLMVAVFSASTGRLVRISQRFAL